MSALPTEPGYYWAKLKTPSGGHVYNVRLPSGEISHGRIEPETDADDGCAWVSNDWGIVEVHDNNGEPGDDDEFSVSVFGIPVTQWPLDFFWGPKVNAEKPQ